MSETSLANILDDDYKPEPPAAVETPEPSAEAPAAVTTERAQSRKSAHQEKEFAAQGLTRDPDTGQFAKKDAAPQEQKPVDGTLSSAAAVPPAPAVAAPAAPAAEQMTAKEAAFLRAAQEERGKRQELERRLAALEAGKPQEPAKTFWDDPEGALARHKQEIEGVVTSTRLSTAEAIARGKYPDFDAKIETFKEVLTQTPGVYQQWMQSPDPAEFAYRMGKNHQELQQAGSIDGLRAQITKETEVRVRAQIEAELKVKAEAAAKERAALPSSLSDARGTTVNRPVWNGPTPLEDILKG